jgi:hypothetical protein
VWPDRIGRRTRPDRSHRLVECRPGTPTSLIVGPAQYWRASGLRSSERPSRATLQRRCLAVRARCPFRMLRPAADSEPQLGAAHTVPPKAGAVANGQRLSGAIGPHDPIRCCARQRAARTECSGESFLPSVWTSYPPFGKCPRNRIKPNGPASGVPNSARCRTIP